VHSFDNDAESPDELVRRNFAFVDLCGFTKLTDEDGVEQAVLALSTFRSVIRERAGWRGVRVAKWLGDGAMLVATEPRPLIDAVLRMEQALDQRGCPLPLRGGLAAGRVILFEGDDYIGRAVNLAARLCDEASPHQLLITASLFEAGGDGLAGEHLGPHPVRGFSRPVEIVDLHAGRWHDVRVGGERE
jgi:class 3 adenylate cyclase